jgi:phage terminase large subunit-like protein
LTTDLTSLHLTFPDIETEDLDQIRFHSLAYYWLPEATAEEERKKLPWQKWADAGDITLTDGSETDFEVIRQAIVDLAARFRLFALAYDPMYAAYLTQRLELEDGIPRFAFGQTITNFAEPCAMLERLIAKRRIHHNGNQVTRWCISNVAVKTDSNQNMRPVKPKKGDVRRIDGVVSLLMSLAVAMKREGEEPIRDYYDDNEPEYL